MKWRPSFRPGIRIYLILSYLLFVLGGLVTTGLFWFSQQESSAEESLLIQLKERAQLLTVINQMQLPHEETVLLPGTVAAINENLRVFFITPQGQVHQLSYQVLTNTERSIVTKLAQEALSDPAGGLEAEKERFGTKDILYVTSPVYNQNHQLTGIVCLILPLQDFRSRMQGYQQELVQFALGLAVLSLLVGILLAHILSKPIYRAGEMAAQVAGGHYAIRLTSQGPRELYELTNSLNHMAEDLEYQSRLRQQLLSNVTHELARPLGALNLGIESLRSGGISDPEFTEDVLGEINRTLKDVEALIEDLTLAARPNQIPLHLNVRSVALEPFLYGIRSRYAPIAESRDIQLRFDIPCDLPTISADETRLSQILGNLLDNSLKFCPSGGAVMVLARTAPHGVKLCVQDTGPGIPEEDHHKVIQPFYQGRSGQQIRQGMGLGLSIVHQLVQAHQGLIKLENVPGGGLLVTVWLPTSAKNQESDETCSNS